LLVRNARSCGKNRWGRGFKAVRYVNGVTSSGIEREGQKVREEGKPTRTPKSG
jgi:hypothetical protein